MVDTSFSVSLPGGEFAMVMFDDKLEPPVVCSVILSAKPALNIGL